MTFQRARTEEQREVRRRAILDMASAMLDEMAVAALTLNELSRRVGLAKPNVLRYFESREAVLLELLDRFLQEWLTELAGELASGIDENLPMAERGAAVAEILSRSLSCRAVLCELFGAQGSVLEHNVSVEVVARYKRASLDRLTTMAALIQKYLPELGENAAFCSLQTMLTAGALSAYRTPPPSLQAAYQAEPDLARFHLDPKDYLKQALTATLLACYPAADLPTCSHAAALSVTGSRSNCKLRARRIPHTIPERDDVHRSRAMQGSHGGRPPNYD